MLAIDPRQSPLVAATASALLPGAGQALAGRPRRALLVGGPILLAAILVGAAVASGLGPKDAAFALLRPEVLLAILAIDAAIWAWRSVAIVDAWWLVRRGRPGGPIGRSLGIVALLALLVASTAPHLLVGVVDSEALDTLTAVFAPGGPEDDGALAPPPDFTAAPTHEPSQEPSASWIPSLSPSPSPSPRPTTSPTPSPSAAPTPAWARDGRLNLLIVGSDAGPDRWSLRTDTMILASVEVATGRATLFGIPRNVINVPLAPPPNGPGGTYPRLLNSLYVYAVSHPELFPGGEVRGFRAVEGAIATLTGVRVDGMVLVNLAGFVRLVNALGGLDITIPAALHDDNYPLEDGSGWIVLDIKAGRQHLDGRMALAYARSRHQDSDYGRMARQQLVLLALRREVKPCTLVPRIPAVLKAIKGTFWTDLPLKDLPALLSLAARVNPSAVRTVIFAPPGYPEVLTAATIASIRYVVAHPFVGPAPSKTPAANDFWSC
ncbi:MAG: LCP family protein [Candidatus Limnocylindrales bacterium]